MNESTSAPPHLRPLPSRARPRLVASPDFGGLLGDLLRTGHAVRFEARGGSMRPFIRSGDILTIVPRGPSRLRAGDVVLYLGPCGATRVHRIVGIVRSPVRTVFLIRGDASRGRAERIPADRILGKAVRIRRGKRALRLDHAMVRGVGIAWSGLQTVRAKMRMRVGRRTPL